MFIKSRIIRKTFIAIVCLVFVAGIAPSSLFAVDQDFVSLFDRIKQARRNASYRGEVRIERHDGNNVRTINKTVYANPSQKEYRERLILNPEQRNMFNRIWEKGRQNITDREKHLMRYWTSDFQRIRPERNFADIEIHLDLLEKNYTLILTQGEPVAGRATDYVSIEPKYEFRPGNRLWIDEETGLVLKREIFIPENTDLPVYREEFISIQILNSEELGNPPEVTPGAETVDQPERKSNRPRNWQVRDYSFIDEVPERYRSDIEIPEIPEGFMLVRVRVTRENRRQNTFQQSYTDGLIMFSVFQQTRRRSSDQFRSSGQRGRSRSSNRMFPPGGTMLSKNVERTNYIVVGFARKELLQPVLDSFPAKKSR